MLRRGGWCDGLVCLGDVGGVMDWCALERWVV